MDPGFGAAEKARADGAGSAKKWAIRFAKTLAVLYLLALVGAIGLLRYVGEAWWVTTVGLYFPRVFFGVPLPFVTLMLFGLGLKRWVWTQLASTVLLLFGLMGFVLPWPHSVHRNAPVIRVLSYNIDAGNDGFEGVVQQIDAYSPDTIFLQEISRVEDLVRRMRSRYPTVHTSGQFMMASRYPVLSASEDPDKLVYLGRQRSPRFLRYVLDTPLGHIVFYNVHPLSPREDFYAMRGQGLRREILSGRLFSGAASAQIVKDNAGLRALQVEAFSKAAAKETDPVVIAGDTNLPGLSELFGRYLSGYEDGFRKAGWGFGYTFPSDPLPWMRIDRILATSQLRFVGFGVGTSTSSDHRCIVAEIQRLGP
jgi:endonuclease/exonuclease/phosphatase (EEP) superfamily protein YafD